MPRYARIDTPPDPAGGGSSFSLRQDEGARLPRPPFVALVWDPDPSLPLVEGETAEYPLVTQITGDVVRVVRAGEGLRAEIASGWRLADWALVPAYERGGSVTLRGHFASHQGPYRVFVRTPGGSVFSRDAADGVEDDGEGNASWGFVPGESGWWGYRWRGESGDLDDNHFFIDHSSVL